MNTTGLEVIGVVDLVTGLSVVALVVALLVVDLVVVVLLVVALVVVVLLVVVLLVVALLVVALVVVVLLVVVEALVVVAAVTLLVTELNLNGSEVVVLDLVLVAGTGAGAVVVRRMLVKSVWKLPGLFCKLSRFNPKLVALFPLPNVAKINEWSLPGILGIILDGSVRSIMSLCSS